MSNEDQPAGKVPPRTASYTFQLPALSIPHSSLTDGTSIPPPPPSPPPSPPAALNTRNPLRSHPTSSHNSPAQAHPSNGLNGNAPSTPTPESAADPDPKSSHKRNPTDSSAMTPPSKKRSLSILRSGGGSVGSSSAPNPIRKLLGLRSLSRGGNQSTDSLVDSPSSPADRPQSPSSVSSPLLRRRTSSAFWRKTSLFGSPTVVEEEEGKENKKNTTPPPMLPEIGKLNSRKDEGAQANGDGGWLDGQMFKNIK